MNVSQNQATNILANLPVAATIQVSRKDDKFAHGVYYDSFGSAVKELNPAANEISRDKVGLHIKGQDYNAVIEQTPAWERQPSAQIRDFLAKEGKPLENYIHAKDSASLAKNQPTLEESFLYLGDKAKTDMVNGYNAATPQQKQEFNFEIRKAAQKEALRNVSTGFGVMMAKGEPGERELSKGKDIVSGLQAGDRMKITKDMIKGGVIGFAMADTVRLSQSHELANPETTAKLSEGVREINEGDFPNIGQSVLAGNLRDRMELESRKAEQPAVSAQAEEKAGYSFGR